MIEVETQNYQHDILHNVNSSYEIQRSFYFTDQIQKQRKSFQDQREVELGVYQTTSGTNMNLFQRESQQEVDYYDKMVLRQSQQVILTSCLQDHWNYDKIDVFHFANNNDFQVDMQINQEFSSEREQINHQTFYENQQYIDKNQQLEIINKSQQRIFRVQRYLAKKANRSFCKKISYQCRKNVADKRIRIKGRFVNKKQAQELLKIQLQKQMFQISSPDKKH